MSILYKPPLVNTGADPGLQYATKKEIEVFSSTTTTEGDERSAVVLRQVNNLVTNVFQVNPSDTVLDLVDLNQNVSLSIDSNTTATILTGNPLGVDRAIQMPPAAITTGRRMIIINRSETQHLIVKNELSETIVVVQAKTSEEILSDGYCWIAVN